MDDLIKDADEYRDAVAEFIRSKGITRCPTACVLPTQGLIAAADRIALAKTLVIRQLAAPCDEGHRSRHPSALNFLLHYPAETRKAGSGESDIFGRSVRQWE